MPSRYSFIYLFFFFSSFAAAAQEYGTVYFYRSGSLASAGVNYTIYDDTMKIGKMEAGRVLMYYAKPGSRKFVAKMESQATTLIEVEAGKSYFVECGITVGVLVGNPTMRQVTSQRAVPAIARINPDLKINPAQIADFKMDETAFKNDTIRALSNLYERKRKGGNTRGVIFLVWGIAGLASGEPAALPGVAVLGLVSVTGFTQAGKYNGVNLDKTVKDYQDGKPLPPKIKSKFKEKDFR